LPQLRRPCKNTPPMKYCDLPEDMTLPNNRTIYEIIGRDSVHPFPARMAPGLALDVLENSNRPLCILDPMSGSGTVLAVAQSKGHHAIGIDIDPLSVLISRVWTTPVNVDSVLKEGKKALKCARGKFSALREEDAYPIESDNETKSFLKFWFDDNARRQLTSIASSIHEIQDVTINHALWCAFSRLIIAKKSGASLAMDLSHSRPHRAFRQAPSEPFSNFLSAVNRVAKNCIDSRNRAFIPTTSIREGDARNMPLDDGSVDMVLTSPPYLNAIDYFRCSKFSLVWMGYSIDELRYRRSVSVGTEVGKKADDDPEIQDVFSTLNLRPELDERQKKILTRYIDDMRRVVRETSRVLVQRGHAVYVIGENTVRGTFIPNAKILETVAEFAGLRCTAKRSRELPPNRRYLPPPATQSKASSLGGRLRREVILTFNKPA